MKSSFASFKSQQSLQRLRQLLRKIDQFTENAHTFNLFAGNLDAWQLVNEGNQLLTNLGKGREEFAQIRAEMNSLRRSLSKTAPEGVLPPAAQWGNEFRAVSKQIMDAIYRSEVEIRKLLDAGTIAMNLPARTATAPENIIELIVLFADLLTRYLEYLKTRKRT
jgi:hypothetical protein